ncbi:MAG: hypothetical protein ACRDQ2_05970, partial [Gaiellales bacterium]
RDRRAKAMRYRYLAVPGLLVRTARRVILKLRSDYPLLERFQGHWSAFVASRARRSADPLRSRGLSCRHAASLASRRIVSCRGATINIDCNAARNRRLYPLPAANGLAIGSEITLPVDLSS